MADDLLTIKLYYDYKSPYAYLAMHPAYALMESHRVRLHYIPHELDVRGSFRRRTRPAARARLAQSPLPVSRRPPLRERARHDHPRTAEDLRLETLADVRSVRRQARALPPLLRPRLRALLQTRTGYRKRRRARGRDEGNGPRRRRVPALRRSRRSCAICPRRSRQASATASSACRLSSSMANRFGATIASNGSSRSSTRWG